MDDLEDLFREHADRIHAYARRHVGPDSADDVVSETFLVAWRRRDVLPERVLPWLIVTARHIIANQRRSGRRADQLWLSAVRDLWQAPRAVSPDDAMVEREQYLEALGTCTRPEREALLLVAWDGLSLAEAAAVAGCSVRAFTVRLSRALYACEPPSVRTTRRIPHLFLPSPRSCHDPHPRIPASHS